MILYACMQGCAIGCDICDGSTRGPIPHFTPDLKPEMNQTNPALCRKMGKDPSCFPGAKQVRICANSALATV